MEGREK
jgi:hypothetical protein